MRDGIHKSQAKNDTRHYGGDQNNNLFPLRYGMINWASDFNEEDIHENGYEQSNNQTKDNLALTEKR